MNRRQISGLAGLGTAPALIGLAFVSVSPGTAAGRVPPAAVDTGTFRPATSIMPSADQARTASATCAQRAAGMTRRQQVGQVFMVGVSSTGVSASTMRSLRRYWVGSVVLLGNSTRGVTATKKLTASIRRGSVAPTGTGLLVATDQEGGLVQRLRGPGFERIPSARTQAQMTDKALASSAIRWARQLKAAGVNLNLAPVADVVPRAKESTNEPIGRLRRGYGSDPAVVARKVAAVTTGLAAGGVGSSVKHYPGLGQVVGNTDHQDNVVDSWTTRDDPALRGFAVAVKSGVNLLMVSSVRYTKIDPTREAVFSPVIMTMIRRDLGFGGVIVSDDIGAAKAVAKIRPGTRAVRFLVAGGDLVINADPSALASMARAVESKAAADKTFATALQAKVARILAVKSRLGLATCAP